MLQYKKNLVFLHPIWSSQQIDYCCRKGFKICLMDVKRESGASPEQSRCCKLQDMLQPPKEKVTVWNIPHGKTGGSGSKSEDLPSRFFLKLSRKKLRNHFWRHIAEPFPPLPLSSVLFIFPKESLKKQDTRVECGMFKNIKIKNEEEIYLLKN